MSVFKTFPPCGQKGNYLAQHKRFFLPRAVVLFNLTLINDKKKIPKAPIFTECALQCRGKTNDKISLLSANHSVNQGRLSVGKLRTRSF